MTAEMLPLLTETERRTLARYLATLRQRLGPLPVDLRVFGSVARGERLASGHADLRRVSRKTRPMECR